MQALYKQAFRCFTTTTSNAQKRYFLVEYSYIEDAYYKRSKYE